MDANQSLKTREVELEEKGFDIVKVSANSSVLLQITKHANSLPSEKGWGKLLGYFDPETHELMVEKSYPLLLSKTDEKIRKEDPAEELIKKKINEYSFNYRQVGFYIISSDEDIYTYSILNYLVNNDKFGNARTFLHFSLHKAKLDLNPFAFYEVSETLNRVLELETFDNNRAVYKLNEEALRNLDFRQDPMFTPLPFKVSQGPIFSLVVRKVEDKLISLLKNGEKADEQRSELLTKHLNDCINRQAFLVHNHIQNKKPSKQDTTTNLYGGYLRLAELLRQKRELLQNMDSSIAKLQKIADK